MAIDDDKTAEQTARFAPIDLDSGKSEPISPRYTYLGAPLPSDMIKFLQAVIKKRQIETFRGREAPTPDDSTPQEYLAYMDELLAKQIEPVDVPLRLTYSDRSLSRKWERTEVLHYEPKDDSVRVIHGTPRPIVLAS